MTTGWGPQATGGMPPPVRQSRGGGYLWLLFFLTLIVTPLFWIGFFGLSFAGSELCTPVLPDGTVDVACQQLRDEARAGKAGAAVIWAIPGMVSALLFFVVGAANARKKRGVLYGRPVLITCMALFMLPLLLIYLVGYGVGALFGVWRRQRHHLKAAAFRTEGQQLAAAPDVAAAITDVVVHRTGKLPGAVLGWSGDGGDRIVTAEPRGGVLVMGPPGSGKTSACLIPSVLIAPGACVSSSIKLDVLLATYQARARRGRVWHFDPGGDEVTPEGVVSVRWSPLVSIHTWDDALQVGATMAAPAVGGKGNGREDAHFVARATVWLQVLLYAAHLNGRDIATVANWATAAGAPEQQEEVLGILDRAADDGDEGADIAGANLLGLIATPDKERGSIISTMQNLLRVYHSISARRIGKDPNFDPTEFVRSNDTLYITARPDKQALYAPLLAALLEQIRFQTYDRHKRVLAGLEPEYPHVTFVLDEANTTAPIPLPEIISEAGGQGLHIIVGIQALGPAVARWGEAAKSFLTLFPTKVIFRGVFDADTTAALSRASGEFDRQMTSYSISTSYVGQFLIPLQSVNPSYSTTRQKVLTEGDITSIPGGYALVWEGPNWGLLVIGYHFNGLVWITLTQQAERIVQTTTTEELHP